MTSRKLRWGRRGNGRGVEEEGRREKGKGDERWGILKKKEVRGRGEGGNEERKGMNVIKNKTREGKCV